MLRVFCLCLLTTPALAGELIVAPAIGTRDEIVVDGRLLDHGRPVSDYTLWNNVGALAASARAGAVITVSLGEVSGRAITDDDGDFSVSLKPAAITRFKPGRSILKVAARDVSITVPVIVIDDKPELMIISDFDDTVAISDIVSTSGVAKTALMYDGETHPPVPGMASLYRCFMARPVRPPLVFVSGSPIQFSPRLVSFLSHNAFPFAGLMLRRLSPKTMKDYKQPAIRRLLGRFSAPVVFFGDSGERDPEVYAEIRKEHPERILRTYIRDAGRSEDPARFKDALLFSDAKAAALDASAHGFIPQDCASTIR